MIILPHPNLALTFLFLESFCLPYSLCPDASERVITHPVGQVRSDSRFEQALEHSCFTRPAMDSHCHSRQRRLGTSVAAQESLSVRFVTECVLLTLAQLCQGPKLQTQRDI